jgi:hypothetical protein
VTVADKVCDRSGLPSAVIKVAYSFIKEVIVLKDNHSLKQNQQSKSPKKKRKQEKVNWIEIMGMNRDRYGRRNGAVRRK